VTIAIYCYEIFSSYHEYIRYSMTNEEKERLPLSMVEKLEHDENNIDRANYHPLYVLVYLLYYLLLSSVMVLQVLLPGFSYSLELTLGVSAGYFLLVSIWRPYHSSINIHNHFLKLYYGTLVLFMVICYVFTKVDSISSGLYIALMYVVMVLLMGILVGGFLRILIEIKYRKSLEQNNSLLVWTQEDGEVSLTPTKKNVNVNELNIPNKPTKKQALLMKNQYAFKNQLKEISHNLLNNNRKLLLEDTLPHSIQDKGHEKFESLHPEEEEKLIKQIRIDLQRKKESLILEDIKQEIR